MMRKALLLFLGTLPSVVAEAQLEFGASAGGYLYHLHGFSNGSYERPSFSSDQAFPFTAGIHYAERTAHRTNLFVQVDYSRAVFTMHSSERTHVGGNDRTLDLRLDALHFILGPEVGRGAFTWRLGLQIGGYVGARESGYEEGYYSGPDTTFEYDNSTRSIDDQRASDFNGDLRAMLAVRYRRALCPRWWLILDPYCSATLASRGGVHVLSAGFRIGICRRSEARGVWTRLRAGAPTGKGKP